MTCREVRKRLADDPQAAKDEADVRDHLSRCPACRELSDRLAAVDQALGELDQVDPPRELIQRTLARVGSERPARRRRLRLVLAIGSATAVCLFLASGLFIAAEKGRSLLATSADALSGEEAPAEIDDRFVQVVTPPDDDGVRGPIGRYHLGPTTPASGTEASGEGRDQGGLGFKHADQSGWSDEIEGHALRGHADMRGSATGQEADRKGLEQDADYFWRQGDMSKAGALRERLKRIDRHVAPAEKSELLPAGEDEERERAQNDLNGLAKNRQAENARRIPEPRDASEAGGERTKLEEKADKGRSNNEERNKDSLDGLMTPSPTVDLPARPDETVSRPLAALEPPVRGLDKLAGKAGPSARSSSMVTNTDKGDTYQVERGTLEIGAAPAGAEVFVDGKAMGTTPLSSIDVPPGVHRVELRRAGYLDRTFEVKVDDGKRVRLNLPAGDGVDTWLEPGLTAQAEAALDGEEQPPERLHFIPAQGYFRNTYLPGDPRLAWLRERLQTGLFLDGERLALERFAVAYAQPFDPPRADGLAVYLAADRAGLEGPTRLTVQVGLKGSTRHATRRAALNAVLVVDLRAMPSEQARRTMWSLADAMAGAVQAGDRFWLVTVGADAAVKVEPGRFEPTTVRRALAQALLELEGQPQGSGALGEGLERAYALLAGPAGDQAAPLGSNLVLLASAGALGAETDALAELAHRWALAGVTTSTLGVAGQADRLGLGELALAGQGRRRLVAAAADADRLLEAELAASGAVVARAVRLRIRLAQGVRLVSVLGSEPLSAPRAERVRQAEQAIDRRVAHSLGIAADRGEDEEGIQIVIPAFYAGDDHVILLDVVAPGPGPVADVQVRYKDLVKLTNAVARARLSLPNGQRPADPRTWNVSKNLLAYRLSEDLDRAARALAGGRPAAGRLALAVASVRLQRFVERTPQLADDAELARDRTLVAGYLKVLVDRAAWQAAPAVREHLVHSLELAALTKRAHWHRR